MKTKQAVLFLLIQFWRWWTVNTHVHSEHITGTGQLKQLIPECKSVLGGDSGGKADLYVGHGDKISAGELELEARKTPGHTNGCTTYVWHDQQMAFTGDTVFIRGCGRTDLRDGNPSLFYDSVYTQIFSLPDEYILYPAHDYTGQPWTTVGEEKAHNPRLSKSKPEFIKIMDNLNLPYAKTVHSQLTWYVEYLMRIPFLQQYLNHEQVISAYYYCTRCQLRVKGGLCYSCRIYMSFDHCADAISNLET